MNDTKNTGTIDDNENEQKKPAPIDSKVSVKVEAGGISAKIIAYPPSNGGKEVSVEVIKNALAQAGVVYGISEKIIDTIVATKNYENPIVVAKCMPAKNGENGKITFLFEAKEDNHPQEDAKGYVDFKDLGIVRNITQGTVIANITLPTEGEPGINVKNEPIVQVKGNPAKVSFADNISLSEDGLTLVTTCDGNLAFKGGRFSVEKVFRLDGDVDVSTGNIDFIGEVVIRGDVREGFSVKAKGNITIQGGAFKANIESGGNITIKQGALGSNVKAEGKVEVDFCENSSIKCKESLKAKSMLYCDVFCNGTIDVTSGNGSIVGGKVVSTRTTNANNIGSRTYTPTLIVVGDNAIMMEEKNGLMKKLENIQNEITNCAKITEFLELKAKQYGGLTAEKIAIYKSAKNTIIVKSKDLREIELRIAEIDTYLQIKQNLSVSCRKELNPGVKIIINDTVFVVNTPYQHCIVGLGEDGIVVNNL